MIPVDQTKLYSKDGIHNGNCLAACLASLLEIPLWMVPPFEEMFGRGDHTPRMFDWLEKFFGLDLEWVEGHPVDNLPEYYIASGLSPRGVLHAVIYSKGKLVHDPHFSRAGIAEVDSCKYLVKVSAPEGEK
jgi:hypothetical protein